MDWFFIGHHHHHYAYLSNCFTHYYRDYRYAPTYYHVTVNNFVTHSDPIDHHRSDWSWGRRDRSGGTWARGDGRRPTGNAAAVSYTNRDRGFFFNRGHAPDRDRFGR